MILSFIEHRVVKNFSSMRPMAKNYPFFHKPYTLCVLCVLRGEFFAVGSNMLFRQLLAATSPLPHTWSFVLLPRE
jgi:hypothetical protein